MPAYVGLGSNLDSPVDQVTRALEELSRLPRTRLVSASSLYRSAPMGPKDQPDFINAAAALLTRLEPHKLLAELQQTEDRHERIRAGTRWGPRTLDLDLLLFGDHRVAATGLVVPHPGIAERNFVLLPLDEIAPHLVVPGLGTVRKLRNELAASNAGQARIEKITSGNPWPSKT